MTLRLIRSTAVLLVAGCMAGCGSDDSPAPPDQAGADAGVDAKDGATDGAHPDAEAGAAGSGSEAGSDADAPEAAVDASSDAPADAAEVDASSDATESDAVAEAGADVADDVNAPDGSEDGPQETAVPDTGADSAVEADSAQDAAAESSDAPGAEAGACEVPGPSNDVWRPTVAIKQAPGQKDPTSSTPIVFTATFSEPMDMTSLTADDFVVTPDVGPWKQLVDSGDHMNFELHITAVARGGNYGVALPDGSASDPSGNLNEASSSTDKVYFSSPVPIPEIRPNLADAVINTLPYAYALSFQPGIDPATFTQSDIVNAGTASGVVWQLQAQTPGFSYTLSTTAVGVPGTLRPVIPAGAVADSQNNPNLPSVLVGNPVVYTTLPILSIGDSKANEGSKVTFSVNIRGTVPPGVLFDWTTSDGTAVDGVDYLAKSQLDVAYPTNAYYVLLDVATTPDDALPESHKDFKVQLSNIRGDVYVVRDRAVGTVVNDDRGTSIFAANNGYNQEAAVDDIMIHGNTALVFGTSSKFGAVLERRNATTDVTEQYLTVGNRAAGIAQNESGYYFAVEGEGEGFKLTKFGHATQTFDSDFGTWGEIEQNDQQNGFYVFDVAADDGAVYVLGSRAAVPVWYVERRDATTGALTPAFGSGGVLAIDHAGAGVQESATRAAIAGSSLLLLGHVGTNWRIEKRAAVDGSLDAVFGTAGVLSLDCLARADDLAIHDGSLYVLGEGADGVVISRHDLETGTRLWERSSPMKRSGALAVGADGVFVGGEMDGAYHVERWQHDGTPIWARTYLRDKAPAGARALALHGAVWLYGAGYHSWNGDRDWYYERRSIAEGLTHLYQPGSPPQ